MLSVGGAIASSLNSQLSQVLRVHAPALSSLQFPQGFGSSSAVTSQLSQVHSTLAATPNGLNAANFIANTAEANPANFGAALNSVAQHLGPAVGALAAEHALLTGVKNRGS